MRLVRTVFALSLTALLLAPGSAAAERDRPQQPAFVSDGWSTARYLTRAAGGRITIEGVVEVEVPPGALPADMVVSVLAEVVEADGLRFVAFTFGPHGAVFDVPLKVTASPRLLQRTSPSGLSVFYNSGADASGNLVWELEDAVELNGSASVGSQLHGHRFVFYVDHFSRYGLGGLELMTVYQPYSTWFLGLPW